MSEQEYRCYGCGALKNLKNLEISPYHEEDGLCDEPISPLMVIECEGENKRDGKYKAVVVCLECFHKLKPDMWINKQIWDSIDPNIPFDVLPDAREDDVFAVEKYSILDKNASWCIRNEGILLIRNYGNVIYQGKESEAPAEILKLADEFKIADELKLVDTSHGWKGCPGPPGSDKKKPQHNKGKTIVNDPSLIKPSMSRKERKAARRAAHNAKHNDLD